MATTVEVTTCDYHSKTSSPILSEVIPVGMISKLFPASVQISMIVISPANGSTPDCKTHTPELGLTR
jgi:hypothetical protein